MAQRSRLLAQLKRGLARFRKLFLSTPRKIADATTPHTNSMSVDSQPAVENKLMLGAATDNPLRIEFAIQPTDDRLLASYVDLKQSDPVDSIYLGDGQRADLEGLRPLTETHPNLLRIICVAIAFCDPPPVARISRVLRLLEDEVRQAIEAIANHLRCPVVCAGNIKFPGAFVSAMYRSCLQIMGAAHGDIACWCLQGAMSEPRHTRYALTYWAWHVSQATPSRQLKSALESFPFVLCTVTEHQLSNVIHWLKRFKDLIDAVDLTKQYEERLANLRLT
ncbi:hypothetical protein MSAN_00973700 [Mycena sanguinolenta]|uniref:Uncharacterized protein n=1 Tax=Mycena sanguinolenta TaxID=230812 RepID=A0A8H6YU09_9AGAR|nr:hypothetical protein MSAN_00973700 [Mycena sanguinolenta]